MNAILSPFVFVIEVFYELSFLVVGHHGLAVVCLSICVTTVLFPVQRFILSHVNITPTKPGDFQRLADEIRRSKKVKAKLYHLGVFLRRLFCSNLDNLRLFSTLFLHFPFFVASYFYLSHHSLISGSSFWILSDISLPDQLIPFGKTTINLLPLIMTALSALNVWLFASENKKVKTVLYSVSILFFLFLYNMPSSLVLYWTFNNVIFLSINMFYNPVQPVDRIKRQVLETPSKCVFLIRLMIVSLRKYALAFAVVLAILTVYLISYTYLRFDKDSYSTDVSSILILVLSELVLISVCFSTLKSWLSRREDNIKLVVTIGLYLGHWLFYSFGINDIETLKIGLLNIGLSLFVVTLNTHKIMFRDFSMSVAAYTPALLLLVPIFQYATGNVIFLSYFYGFQYFAILTLVPLLAIIVVDVLTQHLRIGNIGVITTIAIFFSHYTMPMWTNWLKMPIELNIWYQLGMTGTCIAVFVILNSQFRSFLQIMAVMMALMGVGNLSVTLIELFVSEKNQINRVDIPSFFPTELARTPDIHFLIYDAYAAPEILEYFGIDNSAQMEFLRANDFKCYSGVLSTQAASLESMASTFAMLATFSDRPRKYLVGFNPIDKFLKSFGYENYYLLRSYFTKHEKVFASNVMTPVDTENERNVLLDGVIQGEFKASLVDKEYSQEDWILLKTRVIQMEVPHPRMVYSHSPRPGHSQNSGSCLPNEVQLYKERLMIANLEMQDDIENIRKIRKDAIIIVASDHGPYLTGDCMLMLDYSADDISGLHIADRYGVFLAIRWPEDGYETEFDVDRLQNVFYAVIAYLSGDRNLLKSQVSADICFRETCVSPDGIILSGKDQGKQIFDSF